jgi:DNA-binding CsgD family transcriptional regulator
LSEKHGTFSKNEMRLISLMKMNLTSKEIADIIGISADGIKKARYRLRKKINSEDTQLQSYLLNFS